MPKPGVPDIYYRRNCTSFTDVYVDYIKRLEYTDKIPKAQKEKYKVDFWTYKKILNRMCELMMERILKGFTIELFYKLGVIRIDKVRTKMDIKKLRVDWAATVEHNMKIFHFNEHSQGYYFRIKWLKATAIVPYRTYWSFAATSRFKAKLSNAVRNGKTYVTYGH